VVMIVHEKKVKDIKSIGSLGSHDGLTAGFYADFFSPAFMREEILAPLKFIKNLTEKALSFCSALGSGFPLRIKP
jgi:hypothetical protein